LGADEESDRRSDDDRKPDENAGEKDSGKENKEEGTPLYKRPLVVFIGIIVIIAILTAGIFYWLYERSHEWTDDAFIDGYVTAGLPPIPWIVGVPLMQSITFRLHIAPGCGKRNYRRREERQNRR
jgi:hypothetical protein